MVPYIGLSQKWSAAKVKATYHHIVLDWKLFTSLGGNVHCDSSDIYFFDPDIQRRVKYPMTHFLKVIFYLEKAHYWYLTITYQR